MYNFGRENTKLLQSLLYENLRYDLITEERQLILPKIINHKNMLSVSDRRNSS